MNTVSDGEKTWRAFNHSMHIVRGSYSVVAHAKAIYCEQLSFQVSFVKSEFELDENYSANYVRIEARELTRFLIVHAISLRNVDALDFLTQEEKALDVRFHALLELLFLFHGVYVADRVATNSDFWNLVLPADIEDKTFLSFHVFNYTYHMGKRLLDSDNEAENLDGVFSMVKGAQFYQEDLLQETREFLTLFIDKLISITMGPYFDESFKRLYEKYNPLAIDKAVNPSGWDFPYSLYEALVTFSSTPLIVEKLRSLYEDEDRDC